MNLNLKLAHEKAIEYARNHTPITTELLINLEFIYAAVFTENGKAERALAEIVQG